MAHSLPLLSWDTKLAHEAQTHSHELANKKHGGPPKGDKPGHHGNSTTAKDKHLLPRGTHPKHTTHVNEPRHTNPPNPKNFLPPHANNTGKGERIFKGLQSPHTNHTKHGENIFKGKGITCKEAVAKWASQQKAYEALGSPAISESNKKSVHEYTQLVWKTTTKLGCGIAGGKNGTVITCEYVVAGNVIGQKPN